MAVGIQGRGFRNVPLPFFRAGNMVINKNGWFIYNGTPKLGNSPISWDVSTGTGLDPFGNVLASGGIGASGGFGIARYSSNVVQQFIGIDPVGGQISLGSAGRTATYRPGSVAVQNSLPFNLELTSPFDTGTTPTAVAVQLISGALNTHAGTLLVCSPGAPSTPLVFALQELVIDSVLQTIAFAIYVLGDTNPRMQIDQNGRHDWGPGNAATDTFMRRSNPNQIEMSGTLIADVALQCFAGVQIFQASTTNNVFTIGGLLAANNQFNIDGNGKMTWGVGGATPVDTNFFRSAAALLRTDNSMEIGSTLNIPSAAAASHFGVDATGIIYLIGTAATTGRAIAQVTGDTNNRWTMDASGKQQWGPGNAATDTDLYRLQAGILKTDGEFDANILVGITELALANQGSAPAADAGHTLMVGSNADQMFTVGGNGTSGFVPVYNSDPTLYTVTIATLGQFAKVWNAPAGSLNAGATLELKAIGHGKQGSTAQALTITFMLNGGALFTATLPAAFAAINTNFGIEVEAKIMIFTNGAGGTMWAEMKVMGVTSLVIGALLATQAINTTVANTFSLDANWASTTGAPTVTSNGNYFSKVA